MRYIRFLLLALALTVVSGDVSAQNANLQASLTSATCPGSGCVLVQTVGGAGIGAQITGTFTGTLQFEGSVDGVTFVAVNTTPPNSTTPATSATATGVWTGGVGGLRLFRVRCSAYTSGTAVVTLQLAPGTGR